MKKLFIILFSLVAFVSNAQNTLNNIGLTSSTPSSVAYSLRLLSSSYAGPLVRIKVGTSFYDVYPDLSTNKFSLSSKISASISTYNAAAAAAGTNALSTIISGSTDATVVIWYDQSGNGVHVLSNTSTAKIITAGTVNTLYGQPTIYFSGSNGESLLTSSNTVDYSALSGATVNAVAQNVATTSSFAGVIGAAYALGNPGYNIAYDATSGKGYASDGAGCTYGGTSSSTTPQIITNIFTNTTTNLSNTYINGVLKTPSSTSPCTLTHTSGSRIYIGSARGYGPASIIGNISEAIIFPKQLVDAERNPLETNQSATYFSPGVSITSSATNNTSCSGASVTFTANIFNFTSTPTYQWYKNGTAISGATSSTYTTSSLNNNDQIKVICNNPPSIASNTITSSITAGPSAALTVSGDACMNKTTLSTTTGLSSYTWYKDNVSLSGATTNTYLPTVAGDYKVSVSNGTCSSTSSDTTIYSCGVTADGKMVSITTPGSLLSLEGGANFGTGLDYVGKIINTTGLTTTTGTIGATTAVLGGVISATNAVTTSIGVIYSTDPNFSTSSNATIQSNVIAGTYTSSITGLSSTTTYYAKSYVVNKAGTTYGPVVSFTTPAAYVAPIITTTDLVLNLDAAHPDSYSGSGTTWTDVSNNNNSVTLPSVLASSYSATTGGGSFTFNSNNAINKFSSTSINNWNINTTNAISVETWIKYTSNGGLQFYFQDAALNYRYGFDQNGHFYYDLGCHCDRNPSTATLTADTWHHLVITAGKEAANGYRIKSRFYIDGAQVYSNDEGMSSLPNITTPYYFGDDNYHYYPLNANVGVIRVYKSALSQAEITLNFNAQKARFGF